MDKDNIINLPPRIVDDVGGLVDESGATLCIYGESLDPDELTGILKTKPTCAFKKGHKRRPGAKPSKHGAWLLEVRGEAPKGPQELIQELLMHLPSDVSIWQYINEKYKTRISVGIHFFSWNRGFSINPELLGMVANLGLELDFDLYSYLEEGET